MSRRETIRIGELVARPGEQVHGFLDIGETTTGSIRLPVVIVNGEGEGPVLCLTAGVHATEYPPIDAVMRLLHELRPAEMNGAVIAVPIANMHYV